MRRAKPFAVERRVIAKRPSRTQVEVHRIAVAAVEYALRPVADDVARLLADRTSFPRVLWGEVI